MKPIIINIDWYKIIIEKENIQKTAPDIHSPIHYNEIDIKRKYYKKTDPEYHRRSTKPISKFLKSDKTVKQEPLLDPCYLFTEF